MLGFLRGTHRLIGLLLYGGGLRLGECVALRVKDVDLERRELVVRRGKAGMDRVTVLPESAREGLADQLRGAKLLHERDVARGHGWVELPRLEALLADVLPRCTSETLAQDPAEFRRKFRGLRQLAARDAALRHAGGNADTLDRVSGGLHTRPGIPDA